MQVMLLIFSILELGGKITSCYIFCCNEIPSESLCNFACDTQDYTMSVVLGF